MPSIEDLAQFKQTFADVGGETAILADRGEEPEDAPPPEAPPAEAEAVAGLGDELGAPGDTATALGPEVDDGPALDELDLDDLLGTTADTDSEAVAATTAPAGEEVGVLDDLDLDAPPPTDEGEAPATDDFDPDALQLPGEEDPESTELDESAADAGDLDLGALELPEEGEAPAADDFDLDALELPGEEEPTVPAAGAEAAGMVEGEEADLDLDALQLPGEEELGEEEPAAEAEALEEAAGADLDAGAPPSAGEDEALDFELDVADEGDAADDDLDLETLDLPDAPGDEDAVADDADADVDAPAAVGEDDLELDLESSTAPAGDDDLAEDAEELTEEIGVDSLDEFAFPDVGDEFGDIGEAAEIDAPAVEAPPPVSRAATEAATGTFQLSERDFERLKANLAELPINLRLAVQDWVVDATSDTRVRPVLEMLVQGAAVSQVAIEVRRLTGKRIEIPRHLERRTGRELQAEIGSLAYRLRRRLVPLLLTVVVLAGAGTGLFFLGRRFVYLPIRAEGLYRSGYEMITQERYLEARNQFDAAVADRPVRGWHHRYAERFVEQQQLGSAEEFYERTLAGDGETYLGWPDDVGAHVALAQVQTEQGKFQSAEKNLRCVLEGGFSSAPPLDERGCELAADIYHFDALLAQADNYLEWSHTAPARLEDARFHYAVALRQYDSRDESVYGMLRYQVHVRDEKAARYLGELLRDRESEIEPVTFTSLAAFLIDERSIDGAEEYLFDALKEAPADAEIHYQLSRYFRAAGDPGQELAALRFAVQEFGAPVAPRAAEPTPALPDQVRLAHAVEAANRLGELLYDRGEILDAERQFQSAIEMFEAATRSGLLSSSDPVFGDLYANMGDIHYYVTANRPAARAMYERAEEIYSRTPPEVDYKLAFLSYVGGEELDALRRLTHIDQALPANENLLFALGNAFYVRGDYLVAQGYYLRLLDMLETRRSRIRTLRIREDADHDALVDDLMKAYNNLGVTLKRISDSRAADTEKLSQALANLTQSHELYDLLNRESDTLVASETANLAFLNTKGILSPLAEFEPEIYRRLARDLTADSF